ncbi:MAG: hypothetical protein H0V19_08375, partial [Euzebyales bacterium]|nr:hypothetical protein [Euzebyales bacterium]
GRVTAGAADRFDHVLDLGPEGPSRPAEMVRARTAELARALEKEATSR